MNFDKNKPQPKEIAYGSIVDLIYKGESKRHAKGVKFIACELSQVFAIDANGNGIVIDLAYYDILPSKTDREKFIDKAAELIINATSSQMREQSTTKRIAGILFDSGAIFKDE